MHLSQVFLEECLVPPQKRYIKLNHETVMLSLEVRATSKHKNLYKQLVLPLRCGTQLTKKCLKQLIKPTSMQYQLHLEQNFNYSSHLCSFCCMLVKFNFEVTNQYLNIRQKRLKELPLI